MWREVYKQFLRNKIILRGRQVFIHGNHTTMHEDGDNTPG